MLLVWIARGTDPTRETDSAALLNHMCRFVRGKVKIG